MSNIMTQEEFIERIDNEETCFSGCYFKDATIRLGEEDIGVSDRARKYNLTFNHCVFERLELSNIALQILTICNCKIHDLIIENTDMFESNIFNNRIINLEVKDSYINKCNICTTYVSEKSTIHNTIIFNSQLHHIVLEDDMIFSNNTISNTIMTDIKTFPNGIGVFMLNKFDNNKIFQSLINIPYFYRCNFTDTIMLESLIRNSIMYESNIIDAIHYSCPSTGSFIGYKVVKTIPEIIHMPVLTHHNEHISTFLIAVLEIPEDAKRSSAFTNKCRADKAKVLRFENLDGTEYTDATEAMSASYKGSKTIYKVGEMVYADEFDEKPYNECSNGIHFFVDRRSAVEYLNLI